MEITVKKLQMIRPEINPKNCNLNLDVDWNVDYNETDSSSLEYVCNLKSVNEFPIALVVEGNVEFEGLEVLSKELTGMILDNCFKIMINMVNLTKESNVKINNQYNDLSTEIPEINPHKKDSFKIHPCLDC